MKVLVQEVNKDGVICRALGDGPGCYLPFVVEKDQSLGEYSYEDLVKKVNTEVEV